jgi:outer membrane protein OmpA-like peptidoglycan-associated protein
MAKTELRKGGPERLPRKWPRRSNLMRATIQILAGVAMMVVAPAFADPAYTVNDVLNFVQKAKEVSLGRGRGLCFDDEDTCNKAATPTRFDLMVNFEFDSDHLTPAAQSNLGVFAQALRDPQMKGTKFAIDGFTDATGTEVYNLHLSERRAEAVVSYLSVHGVDRGSLIAKGFGPTKPRAPDHPFDPINRRVETHLAE